MEKYTQQAFDDFWRFLLAGRPDLKPTGDEKIRLAKKQYVSDLEHAWYAGRGAFIGFVVYYYEVLEEVNPGLKDAEYIRLSQESYKKALRRCYDVGQSEIPKKPEPQMKSFGSKQELMEFLAAVIRRK